MTEGTSKREQKRTAAKSNQNGAVEPYLKFVKVTLLGGDKFTSSPN